MNRLARVLLVVALAAGGAPARAAAADPAALDALTQRISDDLPSLADVGITVVAPDPAANVVRVHVTGDVTRAARMLGDRYGETVDVVEGEAFKPLAGPPCVSQRTICGPVMRGGLELTGTTLGICSSGVEARLNQTGEFGVITAGHCYGSGEIVTHGGVPLGPTLPRIFSGEVDAAFVTHSLGAPTFLPSNWVYYSNADREHPVTAVQPIATEAVGQSVCRTGRTTGPACGSIIAVGATVVIGSVTLRNQRIANTCALPGDSGGPFLSGGTFRGIASAGNYVGSGSSARCAANPFTTYSAADRIRTALGVTILTSSPLL